METNMESEGVQSELTEGLAAPAVRALNNVGVETLAQLSKHSESDITKLHGIGSSALKLLKAKLKTKGLSFRQRAKAGDCSFRHRGRQAEFAGILKDLRDRHVATSFGRATNLFP